MLQHASLIDIDCASRRRRHPDDATTRDALTRCVRAWPPHELADEADQPLGAGVIGHGGAGKLALGGVRLEDRVDN